MDTRSRSYSANGSFVSKSRYVANWIEVFSSIVLDPEPKKRIVKLNRSAVEPYSKWNSSQTNPQIVIESGMIFDI